VKIRFEASGLSWLDLLTSIARLTDAMVDGRDVLHVEFAARQIDTALPGGGDPIRVWHAECMARQG
jgi:hypothetical protein